MNQIIKPQSPQEQNINLHDRFPSFETTSTDSTYFSLLSLSLPPFSFSNHICNRETKQSNVPPAMFHSSCTNIHARIPSHSDPLTPVHSKQKKRETFSKSERMMQGDGSAGRWRVGTNWPSGRQRRGNMTRASTLVGERVRRGQWTGTKDVSDRDGVLVVDGGPRERRCSSRSTNGAKISAPSASYRRCWRLHENVMHTQEEKTHTEWERERERGLRVWKVCRKLQRGNSEWKFSEEVGGPRVRSAGAGETETSGANSAENFGGRTGDRVRLNFARMLILFVFCVARWFSTSRWERTWRTGNGFCGIGLRSLRVPFAMSAGDIRSFGCWWKAI